MNDTTKAFLRNAVLEALSAQADSSALELLSLLNGFPPNNVQPAQPPRLAMVRDLDDEVAHDYHYWCRFIRENFIPFMTSNGRLKFTSHELLTWLENCAFLKLTTGDLEKYSTGREVWRNTVGLALSHLKQQGALHAPAFGKEYQICRPCLPS